MDGKLTIAVTQPEYDKAKSVFVEADQRGFKCVPVPPNDELCAATILEGSISHVIVGADTYKTHLYSALKRGSVIARFGVGYDGVNLAVATQRGILCTNTPGVLDDSVAEHTLSLITASARHLPPMLSETKEGTWVPRVGVELLGKKLVVIGCGAIGCKVARIASLGFGMEVIGCEISGFDLNIMQRSFGFTTVVKDFSQAVSGADFVTIHIPSTEATYHYFNKYRLRECEGAWIINTARGALIDETDLYDALQSSLLQGAALDVFEHEPYAPVDPKRDLRELPNVIMTPHVGSSTEEACKSMALAALENIELATKGLFDEMSLLNREVLAKS